MIDRGMDWLDLPRWLAPDAIILTHAHDDHAGGLTRGARCPVYATTETLDLLRRCPIADRRTIGPRLPFSIGGLEFEAFALEHSIRAPAVGYRITTSSNSVFYAPDVAALHDRHALNGVRLYIGDGASLRRSMVRRRGRHLIGHASVQMQLDWCRAQGTLSAIFTHCGSGIVRSDGRRVNALIRRMGAERGVVARLAHDGLVLAVA
jgi:phosphoribosyl 1,2-cyclic phosphodiesterase